MPSSLNLIAWASARSLLRQRAENLTQQSSAAARSEFSHRVNPGVAQMQNVSRNAFRAAIIVPMQEIETCLALGWRLLDEPHCSGARMLPPKDAREQKMRISR